MQKIRLLRGQVVIREDVHADTSHFKSIVVPYMTNGRDKPWHRGRVLQVGPPALTSKGAEVPYEFGVGDEVIYHFNHHQKAWTRPWVDGKDATWIPQQLVSGVVQ